MCGILAIVARDGRAVAEVNLAALRDRGPDGSGRFDDGSLSLLHTRLAVIDRKQTSNQPIVDPRYALICNGEIYNHRALRKSARLTAHEWRTGSDCEAVAAVFAADGRDGFSQLDGMFAFALYDRAERALYLHRDPIGKKPLYLYVGPERIVVSSSITAIVDNTSGPLTIDSSQIDHYVAHGTVHPARTLFQEIRPVLPGELIRIDVQSGLLQSEQLRAHAPYSERALQDEDPRALDDRIEALIDDAVRKRLCGVEAPVLIFSGGVDSTLLASVMLRQRRDIALISLKQLVPLANDDFFSRYAAHRLGAKVHHLDIRTNMWRNFDAALGKLDQPFAPSSYVFLSLLALAAREHGNVVFTGDGADELFHGYAPLSRWLSPSEPPCDTLGVHSGPAPAMPWGGYGLQQGMVDLVAHAFVKVDKATAENQMEGRCPFLDRDVVALSRALPRQYWELEPTRPKAPLKRILRRHGFPEWFVDRRKIGFAYPLRALLLPLIPRLYAQLDENRDLLTDLRVAVPRSAFAAARDFWGTIKVHVLLRVMQRYGSRVSLASPNVRR